MRNSIIASIVALVAACGGEAREGEGQPGAMERETAATGFRVDRPGANALDAARYRGRIRVLSSDELEGRRPSSAGEEKTVAYLTAQFQEAGLRPGNGDDFTQSVPLASTAVVGSPVLTVEGSGATSTFRYGADHVVWTKRLAERTALDGSELVFVGYGIVAPEYDWNDYEAVDVAGKTVVILVNDPGYATRDEALFRGFAGTYYSRPPYKYEEAARQGAAGAIIVHETGPAGYPWDVVTSSGTNPQFGLVAPDDHMPRVEVEGWITLDATRAIFTQAGQSYDELRDRAMQRDFRPVALGLTASVSLDNEIERSQSRNVVAMVPGSERPDEYVVYMAHWDHLGLGPEDMEDRIYNGAFDNATGTAGLLELANAFASLDPAPPRSVVFLAVTAEEPGYLGSAYYAGAPLFPTRQTVAAINLDGMNVLGPMRDVTVVGFGASDLDDILRTNAGEVGRILRPDPEPEKGFYYRSDHLSFAKVGIPSLFLNAGIEHVIHGSEWTIARRNEYTERNYHRPSDEYDPEWDLSGALDDLSLLYAVGYDLATSADWPNWREGNEFRAIRDADRSGG